MDAVLTKSPDGGPKGARNLQHVKFAYAPGQYLLDVDEETPELFREALRKLKDAGAELVEIDLGVDLTARTTWPIFFHETLTAVREFLAATKCPFYLRKSMRGSGSTLNVVGHARLCVRAPTTSRMRRTAPR